MGETNIIEHREEESEGHRLEGGEMSREIFDTVHVGQNVSDVRKIFAKEGFHHVPVVFGKKLIGILSVANILEISTGD